MNQGGEGRGPLSRALPDRVESATQDMGMEHSSRGTAAESRRQDQPGASGEEAGSGECGWGRG